MSAQHSIISKGDLLLDSMYLGESQGVPIEENTVGIVMTVQNDMVLVYWFERRFFWGREFGQQEWFDLKDEKDTSVLISMRDHYRDSQNNL